MCYTASELAGMYFAGLLSGKADLAIYDCFVSLAALLLSLTCTSHIVRFTFKMTTVTSHAAEITAATEINYTNG